jgi:hypothetical protein
MRLYCPRRSAIALLGLFFALHPPTFAALVLRVEQIGADIRISGSGTANLSALIWDGDSTSWANYLTDAEIYAGPAAFTDGHVSLFSGLVGPSAFGGDPSLYVLPDIAGSGGDLFGIYAASRAPSGVNQLVLPLGYTSGANLSGVSTYSNLTIAELGLAPGQVSSWSWGTGSTADSLRLEVVPVPGPGLPLGALVAFRLARKLRRRPRLHSS